MSSVIVILTFLFTLIRSSESELRSLSSVTKLSKNLSEGLIQNDFHLDNDTRVTKYVQFDENSATEIDQTEQTNVFTCAGNVNFFF